MVAAGVASTPGCPSIFGPTTESESACENETPLLVGLSETAQERLLDRTRTGLLVARAETDGCVVQLSLLPDCVAPGRYTYRPERDELTRFARRPSELTEHLPLAGARYRRALGLFGGLKVQVLQAGKLVAPEQPPVDRRALRGQDCVEATHVASTLFVGAYSVAAADTERLDDLGDLFGVRPLAGRKTVDKRGRRTACEEARKTRDRNDGCDALVSVQLTPLVSRGPSLPEVRISGGRFVLGLGSSDERSKPPHEVEVDDFLIDATEVSVAGYRACVDARRCSKPGDGRLCNAYRRGREQHPINCVSWFQANDFCAFVGKRLPTEAEWERAARGTHRGGYPWGRAWPPPAASVNLADSVARRHHPEWRAVRTYRDGFAETAPVGVLGGRGQAVRDLAGNVMEWTADYYGPYDPLPKLNPTGPEQGTARVVRGSSFGHNDPSDAVSTRRHAYRPEFQSGHIGFRCVKSLKSSPG